MANPAQRRYLEQAQAHQQAGRGKRAQAIYRQILRQEPDCTEALFHLALSLFDAGEPEAAVEHFRRLVALRPEVAEIHYNLGTVLKQMGRDDEAIAAFMRAIALQPTMADAHNNLGTILRQRGELEPALAAFQQAANRAPGNVPICSNLVATLVKLRRLEEAVAAARATLELQPGSDQAHYMLGLALDHVGRHDEAANSFREAVRLNPDNAEWRFHLAAHEGQETPATAPREYVTSLFDAYAERFDAELVGSLQYHTPQHLLAAVTSVAPDRRFAVMDLGCGTGLCGELFRPLATRLAGVDLAPRMIAAARRRDCYDELKVGDIVSALRGREQTFDLILAADVFVYVGDLAETFTLASAALHADGLFGFSVEAHAGNGYILGPTRRYKHGLSYVRRLAEEHGFTEAHAQQVVLRIDSGVDVEGWIVVLRKR